MAKVVLETPLSIERTGPYTEGPWRALPRKFTKGLEYKVVSDAHGSEHGEIALVTFNGPNGDFNLEDFGNLHRIVSAVNGCTGVVDPHDVIPSLITTSRTLLEMFQEGADKADVEEVFEQLSILLELTGKDLSSDGAHFAWRKKQRG